MSRVCVITTYYNPCRWQTRRRIYDQFMRGMRDAGVAVITVECAFGSVPFELPEADGVIQVRAQSLIWQKERLLNLAASWLPESCRYVAWLDADIVFENPDWANDIEYVLRTHRIAQVWETCLRLGQGNLASSPPDRAESFAAVMTKDPARLHAGRYDAHGHTGYGWAMRREIFDRVGLYEHAVSGSADHFMAHAIYGQYGLCVENALKRDARQSAHLQAWGSRFYEMVQGSLGCVPGEIRHLWHGDATNRRYFLRMHDITDLGYDPWTDLHIAPGRPIEWSPGLDKPGLKEYFANYFASRREDGNDDHTEAAA